ncbi:MAG TPA: hypothetical protein VHM20_05820 [Gammaproteobacteria bacterium]|jgi:DNA repair exonuclease SbcCD ATPase subunit|nr:hypothetical protein [Gammaproteobacteria bacterium]
MKSEEIKKIQEYIIKMERHLLDRCRYIENKINEVRKEIPENRTPHKCPVCDGSGNGKGIKEYDTDFEFYCRYFSCSACDGEGIVWG